MGILSLLASFGLDGIMHQFMQEDARVDLVNGLNGARKFLLITAVAFALIMFL